MNYEPELGEKAPNFGNLNQDQDYKTYRASQDSDSKILVQNSEIILK